MIAGSSTAASSLFRCESGVRKNSAKSSDLASDWFRSQRAILFLQRTSAASPLDFFAFICTPKRNAETVMHILPTFLHRVTCMLTLWVYLFSFAQQECSNKSGSLLIGVCTAKEEKASLAVAKRNGRFRVSNSKSMAKERSSNDFILEAKRLSCQYSFRF